MYKSCHNEFFGLVLYLWKFFVIKKKNWSIYVSRSKSKIFSVCGHSLQISKDDDGSGQKEIQLEGSPDAVAKAKEMINELTQDDGGGFGRRDNSNRGFGSGGDSNRGFGRSNDSGQSDSSTIRVDSSKIGRVIGK